LTWFVFGIYTAIRMLILSAIRSRITAGFFIVGVAALVLSLPQICLTFQLAILSGRSGLEEGYAYVGSLSPPALLTIVFPNLQGLFRGNCIYSGIFAIFFTVAAFFASDKNIQRIRLLWLWMAALSLLLALGQWSPLYVALIKLTQFYSFRVPAKFIVFFCFSFAMLAGIGVQVILKDLPTDDLKRKVFAKRYLILAAGILVLWGGSYLTLTRGRALLVQVGKYVVENFIYGKPGRPRTLESYMDSIYGTVENATSLLSLVDPWQIWAVFLILASCILACLFMTRVNVRIFFMTTLIMLVVDLYVFAGADIKTDFDSFRNVQRLSPVAKAVLEKKQAGTLHRIYGYRRGDNGQLMPPSANMIYGTEDIGAYSPLVMKRYFETIGQLGCVNDSNQMLDPDPKFILERLPLLDALDVSHVLSTEVMEHPALKLEFHDPASSARLYRNTGDYRRCFFVPLQGVEFAEWPAIRNRFMSAGFDPQKTLLLEASDRKKIPQTKLSEANASLIQAAIIEQRNEKETWFVKTTGPGFFVVTNMMYPGWNAALDGEPVPILSAYGLFRAVYLANAGEHRIDFAYSPFNSLKKSFATWA
ncbi:MAG TPA: hypothetical protein PK590_07500, partial [Candidatus Omnitrophota bacterium]|nr:hypothetical protein [Candidatus Omnitrophota bacterium]